MPKRSIDTRLDFLSPLRLIPGLGAKRVAALEESGLRTIGDLLHHFPRRYIDRSRIVPLEDVREYLGKQCTVVGSVTRTRVEPGRKSRFRVLISDETGSLEALWFHGIPYYRKAIHSGMRLCLTGKIGHFGGFQMVHPLMESLGTKKHRPDMPFLPVYPVSTAMREVNLQQKSLVKAVDWCLRNLKHYPQILPRCIEDKKGFPPMSECIRSLHFPQDLSRLESYRERVRYEELYQTALALRWNRRKFALPGRSMCRGDMVNTVRKALPFSLTKDQDRALESLLASAEASTRMHSLLQGDVGSGKTVVALLACLPALNEGYQVAWLSPTEVLARQSRSVVEKWLEVLGVQPELLTAGRPVAKQKAILSGLKSATIRFVIGTHSLIQERVTFRKLGIIVIDEQQRFGVEQRLALQAKDPAADFLLMSATPIPQTLAKTLYGDLEVVTIHKRPVGRKPVSTHYVPKSKRAAMEKFIAARIENGEQAFYIVPRIEQSDPEDTLSDSVTVATRLRKGMLGAFPVGIVHGKMSNEQVEDEMKAFSEGKTKVLVATTVVEVGVDVPAATIMVIENAERFGLCQLHQLRGRVGRGGGKAYCFLPANETYEGGVAERIRRFCRTEDGFEIAELDLRLRGPGEITGTRQAGFDELRFADIIR
ncbi:MAG: DEAD/DEAH box helicase, partial [Chitinivibrionales bacterium]|nr:DEAD/DEAH box helicase [Chitinivibrionales bacterium]MBD3357330.1 DEAD/DEAH box helicase [Chitinivibrionales bacterium]